MIQNDKYLKESIDILNRKFGEPLPTLEDTMKAHKLKKEGGPGSGPKKGGSKDRDWTGDTNGEGDYVGEGGPGSGPKPKPGGAKDIEKKMSKAADDANAKMDRAEKEMERKAKEQAFKDMEKEFGKNESANINERLTPQEQKLFMIVGIRMMKKARWYGKRYNTALAETIRRLLGGMQWIDNILSAPKKDQAFLEKGEKYWPTNKYSKRALIGMGEAFSKMKKFEQKNFVIDLISFGNWKKLKKTQPDTLDNMVKKYGKHPLKEGPDDKRAAKSQIGKIAKLEQNFRKEMFKLEQILLQDPRTENKKAAKDLKVSYRKNITQFMRDIVLMTKRMK